MANGQTPTLTQVAQDPALAPVLANMPQDQAVALAQRVHSVVSKHTGGGGRQKQHRRMGSMPAEKTRLWNNYYSIIRFQAAVSVAAPVTTLTFGAGTELRPFSYRINDPLTSAGFDASLGNATEAETNLTKAGETIAGELVRIHGLSLMPSTITDIEVWKQLLASTSVAISMDGDAQRYRLGRVDMIPGSGGTFGSGPTSVITPDLASALGQSSAFSNGYPVIDNYYPFPMPMIWSPSGETDSNFNVVLKLQRQIVIVETARAAAAGVAAFTPPTAVGQFGSFVDIMARLHCEQISARSVNQ